MLSSLNIRALRYEAMQLGLAITVKDDDGKRKAVSRDELTKRIYAVKLGKETDSRWFM